MANKFIKYTIKEQDPKSKLYLCVRNQMFVKTADEGCYYKTKSGKIIGNVTFFFDNRRKDFTGQFDPAAGVIPEEDIEQIKEED